MTQLGKLEVPIEGDSSKFVKATERARDELGRFVKATEQATKAAEKAEESFTRNGNVHRDFARALKGTATELNSIWSIAQRVTGSVAALYDAMADGARITDAGEFFRNAGKDLTEYRQATNGLISDAKLMKKANLADSMGISGEQFQKFSQIAYAAALKTGQSFEHMFDSIIVGSARSSRLLLDNLGIIVSVKQANEAYAESLGKTVEQLTAEEKQLAFINAAVKAGEGAVDELRAVTESTAAVYDGLAAAAENAMNSIKQNMAEAGKGMAKFAADTMQAFADMSPGAKIMMIGGLLGGGGVAAAAAALGGMGGMVAALGIGTAGLAGGTLMGEIGRRKDEYQKGAAQDIIAEQMKAIVGSDLGAEILRDAKIGAPGSTNPVEALMGLSQPEWDEYINAHGAAAQQIWEMVEAMKAANREYNLGYTPLVVKRSTGETQDTTDEDGKYRRPPPVAKQPWEFFPQAALMAGIGEHLAEYQQLYQEQLGTMLVNEMKTREKAEKERASFLKSLNQYERKVYLEGGAEALARYQETLITGAEELNKRLEEQALERERIQAGASRVQAVTDPLQMLFSGNAGGIVSTISDAVKGGIGTAIGGATGGAVGAIIGFLIDVLGPVIMGLQPVADLLASVGKFVGHLVTVGLLPLLNTLRPLNSAIEMLGVALGFLIRDLITDAIPIFEVLVWAVAGIVKYISAAIVVLSPLVALILHVITTIGTFGIWLIAYLSPVKMAAGGLADAMRTSTIQILGTARMLHNGLLSMIRMIPGLEEFGDWFTREEYKQLLKDMGLSPEADEDPNKENTEATKENTQAIRDLAREFRNLPSGYKIASADYATSRPGATASNGGSMNNPGIDSLQGAVTMRDFWRGRR